MAPTCAVTEGYRVEDERDVGQRNGAVGEEIRMESAHVIHGTVAPGFEAVRSALAEAQADDAGGAQLCVYRDGRPVVDLWSTPRDGTAFDGDTLTVLRSATKGALATCAAMLIERGLLDVEAPVARYWPEFARNGKDSVTTAHILTHTAGLPGFSRASGIRVRDLGDWERVIRALEDAPVLWAPGTTQGSYHGVTIGFLAGEVIRRITGQMPGRFFAENVADPLGLEFWIGLPAEYEHRVCPFGILDAPVGMSPAADRQYWAGLGWDLDDPVVDEILYDMENRRDIVEFLNTREGHAICLPGANGIASARSLARMYAALIGDVEGVRLISRETLNSVRTGRTHHLPNLPGMAQLQPGFDPDRALGFWLSEVFPGSFGHPGAGGVRGFANPERGLSAAYTCTNMYTVA